MSRRRPPRNPRHVPPPINDVDGDGDNSRDSQVSALSALNQGIGQTINFLLSSAFAKQNIAENYQYRTRPAIGVLASIGGDGGTQAVVGALRAKTDFLKTRAELGSDIGSAVGQGATLAVGAAATAGKTAAVASGVGTVLVPVIAAAEYAAYVFLPQALARVGAELLKKFSEPEALRYAGNVVTSDLLSTAPKYIKQFNTLSRSAFIGTDFYDGKNGVDLFKSMNKDNQYGINYEASYKSLLPTLTDLRKTSSFKDSELLTATKRIDTFSNFTGTDQSSVTSLYSTASRIQGDSSLSAVTKSVEKLILSTMGGEKATAYNINLASSLMDLAKERSGKTFKSDSVGYVAKMNEYAANISGFQNTEMTGRMMNTQDGLVSRMYGDNPAAEQLRKRLGFSGFAAEDYDNGKTPLMTGVARDFISRSQLGKSQLDKVDGKYRMNGAALGELKGYGKRLGMSQQDLQDLQSTIVYELTGQKAPKPTSIKITPFQDDMEKYFKARIALDNQTLSLIETNLPELIKIQKLGIDYMTKLGNSPIIADSMNRMRDVLLALSGSAGLQGDTATQSSGGGIYSKLTPNVAARIAQIEEKYGMKAGTLVDAIAFETGGSFDPAQKNMAGGQATGLIQFMNSTAQGLGTTTTALGRMSSLEQLEYVDKFFSPYGDALRASGGDFADVYSAIIGPAYISKPDSYVMYAAPSKAYKDNINLDSNKDGKITKKEAADFAQRRAQSYQSAGPPKPNGVGTPPAYTGREHQTFLLNQVTGRTVNYGSDVHGGFDFQVGAKGVGDTVYSPFNGTVILAGYETNGFGNAVIIRLKGKNTTAIFGHFEKIYVKVGQEVSIGMALGIEGTTGHSTGIHLHLEFRNFSPMSAAVVGNAYAGTAVLDRDEYWKIFSENTETKLTTIKINTTVASLVPKVAAKIIAMFR